jgi:hypothetical protein
MVSVAATDMAGAAHNGSWGVHLPLGRGPRGGNRLFPPRSERSERQEGYI